MTISPMCQYSARDGLATDWHLAHLGRFALGGAGAVMVEATAVSPEGRITHGDLGLWQDAQIAPLARIVDFLKAQGTTPGIQLAHAGRKASTQRPWEGNGPLGAVERARGEGPWQTLAASAIPHGQNWPVPHALTHAEMTRLRGAWRAAALRALAAGFELIEIHAAHGYLLNSFLSPFSNHRADEYGGSLTGRMRFPLEVVQAVREVWPEDKPLSVRISAVDGLPEGGTSLHDSVVFARELQARGVDLVDCSSGGIAFGTYLPEGPLYQVSFAEQIRRETGVKTMAVGMITEPSQAEAIIANEQADLVALARQALHDPQWPHHAARMLQGDPLDFDEWPVQSGYWLRARARTHQAATADLSVTAG